MKVRVGIGVILAVFGSGCGGPGKAVNAAFQPTELTPVTIKKIVESLPYSRIELVYSSGIPFSGAKLGPNTDLKALAECGQKQGWWTDQGQRGPQGGFFHYVKWPLEMSKVTRVQSVDRHVSALLNHSTGFFRLTGPPTLKGTQTYTMNESSSYSSSSYSEERLYVATGTFTQWGSDAKSLSTCGLVAYALEHSIPSLQMRFRKSRESGVWYAAELWGDQLSPFPADRETEKEVPVPE